MTRLGSMIPIAFLLLITACAAGGQGAGTDSGSGGARRDRITADDLEGVVEDNAYDVISRMRPGWLRRRGRSLLPAVFRDNIRVGTDIEALRSIRLQNVFEIRYLNAGDATMRWGTGFTGGVIQIVTRR